MATSTINHNAYGSSHHYGPSASHSRSTANNYHSPSYQSATASVISPTETEFSEAYDAPEAISDWDEKKVGEWLRSINYAQYESLFRKNDIRGETLVEMDQSLLKEIGIKKIGDRVRVFSSIKSLRTRSSGLTRRRNRVSNSFG